MVFCLALLLVDRRLTNHLHDGKPSDRLLRIVEAMPCAADELRELIISKDFCIASKDEGNFFNNKQVEILAGKRAEMALTKGAIELIKELSVDELYQIDCVCLVEVVRRCPRAASSVRTTLSATIWSIP